MSEKESIPHSLFLKYNSIILMTAGLSLDTNSCKKVKVIRFIILLTSIYFLAFDYKYLCSFWDRIITFLKFFKVVWLISYGTSVLYLIVKRKMMIKMAKYFLKKLPPRKRCQVERMTKIFMFFAIICMVFRFSVGVTRSFQHNFYIVRELFRIVIQEFLVRSCMVYSAFMYLTFTYTLHQLDRISNSNDIDFIYKKIEHICLLLRHVDNQFCFIPFVCMSYNFFVVTFVVLNVRQKGFTLFYGTSLVIFYNLTISFVLVLLTRMYRRIRHKLFFIEEQLSTRMDLQRFPVLMESLLNRIQMITSWKMTGLGLFDLDTSLILSFGVHLITFTVMFITLEK